MINKVLEFLLIFIGLCFFAVLAFSFGLVLFVLIFYDLWKYLIIPLLLISIAAFVIIHNKKIKTSKKPKHWRENKRKFRNIVSRREDYVE